jgi:hypothetical protein
MRARLLGLAAACALGTAAIGCGAPPDPTADRAVDIEAGLRAVNRGLALSLAFVASGVVNTTGTPGIVANAITTHFKGETGTCAPATVMGGEVEADLTAGCTIASAGLVVTGRIHAEVSNVGNLFKIALVPDLTVDGGQPLKGTFNIHTENGNTYSYDADLTLGSTRIVAPFVRLGLGNFGSSTGLDATVSGKSPIAYRLETMGVFQGFTGCYPEEGPVKVTGAGVDETWTFQDDTPKSGLVLVTPKTSAVGRSVALPARTGCPRK